MGNLPALGADPGSGARFPWTGPDGEPLPFGSIDEVVEFLEMAKVVSKERVGEGVNNPFKVLLEKDGVRAHAVFRDVHITKAKKVLKGKIYFNFRDDAIFEVAAYRLGRLLGLDNIPPTVVRRVGNTKGTLQLWVESAMTEKKRIARDVLPPEVEEWRLQVQNMRVFDNLIYNNDRNQTNILFGPDWKLWMIDHTRAFARTRQLFSPMTIWKCERRLYEAIKSLDKQTLKAELGPFLRGFEIKALIKRRDLLIARIDQLIAERGAQIVLFDSSR